jgi:hypothetical protein
VAPARSGASAPQKRRFTYWRSSSAASTSCGPRSVRCGINAAQHACSERRDCTAAGMCGVYLRERQRGLLLVELCVVCHHQAVQVRAAEEERCVAHLRECTGRWRSTPRGLKPPALKENYAKKIRTVPPPEPRSMYSCSAPDARSQDQRKTCTGESNESAFRICFDHQNNARVSNWTDAGAGHPNVSAQPQLAAQTRGTTLHAACSRTWTLAPGHARSSLAYTPAKQPTASACLALPSDALRLRAE